MTEARHGQCPDGTAPVDPTSRRRALKCLSIALFGWAVPAWADQQIESTVKVESVVGGLKRTGSGILVGMSDVQDWSVYVLTASHVVAGDAAPRVSIRTKEPVRLGAASIIASEPGDDGLTLLKVKITSDSRVLSLVNLRTAKSLGPGLGVEAVGMSIFAGDWTPVSGQIVRIEGDRLFFSADIDEGNSGGPVFGTGEPIVGTPELIGVVVQVRGKFAVAVTADRANLFLKRYIHSRIDSNHNSIYAKDLVGRWRYFYAGQLNADQKVISFRDNVVWIDHASDMPLPSTFEDVRLRGDTLSFRTRTGADIARCRLRILNRDTMAGTLTDARGESPYRWERIR